VQKKGKKAKGGGCQQLKLKKRNTKGRKHAVLTQTNLLAKKGRRFLPKDKERVRGGGGREEKLGEKKDIMFRSSEGTRKHRSNTVPINGLRRASPEGAGLLTESVR